MGTKTAAYIVTVRARGRFTSIEDFIERVFRHKLRSNDFKHWDEVNPMVETGRIPVNTRHLKNMILAGCFDKIENVQAVTERYAILKRAALKLGFNLRESDAPEELRDKHYFWSQQQIAVSGIGSIDYRRIFSNSPDRAKVKGKAAYISLADVMRDENDGRKAAVCATVSEYSEHSYADRETGQRKRFAKLILSQNNQTAECTLWDEFYRAHKEELQHIKGKIIILTAVIRYSDYTASNALQSYRNSLLFIQ